MNPAILEEQALTLTEVKGVLKDVKERDEELSFRANKTEENLQSLELISEKKGIELAKKLEELEIPRFKDNHIKKIVDLLPTEKDELKVALQGYTITVSNDNLKRIVEVVKEFA